MIFCPDGVSAEVAANSFRFTIERQNTALDNAKELTESADAAQAFAEKDGVQLIEGGLVRDVRYDRTNNTIAVIGAYVSGQQTVSIYDAEDFSLISQITVDFEIKQIDVWDGLVALSDPTNGIVTIYRQSDGGVSCSFSPVDGQTTAAYDLVLIDGYLYYSVSGAVRAYHIAEQSAQPLIDLVSPKMLISRSHHRLIVFSTATDHCKMVFVNSETAQTLKTYTPLPYYSFAPTVLWQEDFLYVAESTSSSAKLLDLDGNVLQTKPTVQTVTVTPTRHERLCQTVAETNRFNVSICYDTSDTVYLQVKTADGTQRRVDYYATSAILLSNGTLLLYTQNGYGLVAVAP